MQPQHITPLFELHAPRRQQLELRPGTFVRTTFQSAELPLAMFVFA